MTEISDPILTPIVKPRILIVEGKDELLLIQKMLERNTINDVELRAIGGVTKLPKSLPLLMKTSGFSHVTSLGIIRDADNNARSSFESVREILRVNGLNSPENFIIQSTGTPRNSIFILPDNENNGNLEKLCLVAVKDEPIYKCAERFIECISSQREVQDNEQSKIAVRAYLIQKELFEIEYYEMLQTCAEQLVRDQPMVHRLSQNSLLLMHAFLNSMYKPDIRLGQAANSDYWPINHESYRPLISYLQTF